MYERVRSALSLSCVLVIVSTAVHAHALDIGSNCSKTEPSVLHCMSDVVPVSVPTGVNHVVIEGVNLETFRRGQFENTSWMNVIHLQINSNAGRYIYANVFNGLTNLQNLKLKGAELGLFYSFSFAGLPNLEKLDLSDNAYLGLNDVLRVLKESPNTTLPSLRWLNLAKLQSVHAAYALDTEAFNILSKRAIDYLDFSHLNIAPLNVSAIEKVCAHVQHVVLNGATVTGAIVNVKAGLPKPCKSLRTLDIRNIYSTDLMGMVNYLGDFNFVKHFTRPFNHIETLLMSNVFHKEKVGEVNITNTVFDLTNNPFSFRTVDISSNNIRVFNVTIYLHPTTRNSVRETDFSDNTLEYISPQTFSASINTERLNLSRNNLNNMVKHHHSDFEILLNSLIQLKKIYLAENGLTTIPHNMFINNSKLRTIDLSDNFLTRIDFKLDHLIYLKILDLSGNRLTVLNADTFVHFQNIWTFQKDINTTTSRVDGLNSSKPYVYLHGNPWECKCDDVYITSIQWIEVSGFVRDNGKVIECTLENDSIEIFQSASQKTESYCHRIKVLKHVLIIGVTLASVIIISVISVIVVRRKFTKKNDIKRFIKKVKAGDKLKNLIFLSFCNEDGDLVLEHIYPRMNEEASKALHCDRNLVCCGELNFRPGMSVCLEAMRCIEDSAVIIFVVSNTFCQKSWCKMEVDTANAQRKPVILLMLEKVKDELMTSYIRKLFNRYTRASWIRDQNGGYPHPPWPVLISSVIELGSSFNVENQTAAERKCEMYGVDPEAEINAV